MAEDAHCPHCDGLGAVSGFVDGFRNGRRHGELRRDIPCFTCDGKGRIPTHQFNWIEEGRVHRSQRQERKESLHAAAARLGISAAEVSAMEMGRMNPAPLHRERDDA